MEKIIDQTSSSEFKKFLEDVPEMILKTVKEIIKKMHTDFSNIKKYSIIFTAGYFLEDIFDDLDDNTQDVGYTSSTLDSIDEIVKQNFVIPKEYSTIALDSHLTMELFYITKDYLKDNLKNSIDSINFGDSNYFEKAIVITL